VEKSKKKLDMLRIIGKQFGEFIESILKHRTEDKEETYFLSRERLWVIQNKIPEGTHILVVPVVISRVVANGLYHRCKKRSNKN